MPDPLNVVFNAYNWYWRATDGRIFASISQSQVPEDDPGYVAFIANAAPAQWPADASGAETDFTLQANALDLHPGLFANDTFFAADQRWQTENAGITVTGMAGAPNGMPLKTDDRSKNFVGLAHTVAANNPDFTTVWVAADWNNYDLNAADIQTMSVQLYNHIHDCFIAYADATAGLSSGKITKRHQINDLFAEVKRRYGRDKWPESWPDHFGRP